MKSVECTVWSVGCKVQRLECRVWSVESEVGSVECRVHRGVKLGV